MSRRGLVLFILLSIIWGLPYLFIKFAVAELDPAVTVFLRTLPASIILLSYGALRGKLRSNLRFWKAAVAFAFVEMVFPWWWVSRAEQEISSGLTGLLLATVPLFGVVIARVRGQADALSAHRLFGMAVGSVGVTLLVGLDSAELNVSLWPVLMVLGAAFGYALGPAVISGLDGLADSATLIGMSLAVVSLVYVPIVIPRWPQTPPSAQAIWSLVVLTLVCTVAAFLTFFALIAEVGPVRATLVTYLNPAVALLLGLLFAAEPLTLGVALGFPLVLAGSYFATRR